MKENAIFKVIVLSMLYLFSTFAFMGFGVSTLISSKSTIEVACGVFGAACWLLVTIYIALKIIKKGHSAIKEGK